MTGEYIKFAKQYTKAWLIALNIHDDNNQFTSL